MIEIHYDKQLRICLTCRSWYFSSGISFKEIWRIKNKRGRREEFFTLLPTRTLPWNGFRATFNRVTRRARFPLHFFPSANVNYITLVLHTSIGASYAVYILLRPSARVIVNWHESRQLPKANRYSLSRVENKPRRNRISPRRFVRLIMNDNNNGVSKARKTSQLGISYVDCVYYARERERESSAGKRRISKEVSPSHWPLTGFTEWTLEEWPDETRSTCLSHFGRTRGRNSSRRILSVLTGRNSGVKGGGSAFVY